MSTRPFDLLENVSSYGLASAAIAIVVVIMLSQPSKLDAIPTVGSSSWLCSWWAGLRYLTNALDVVQEGYEKHKGAPFKIAALFHWLVVVGSREHVGEVLRAPDDILSPDEATEEPLQLKHTMSPDIYNVGHGNILILRSRLTRQLGVLGPEIRDEVITAFDDVLNLRGNEWTSVPALSSVQQVVCRTSNRIFVGLPLCRDPDWIDLNIQHTLVIAKGGGVINLFPDSLKPLATQLFTKVNQNIQRGRELLGPIIEERQRYLNQYGNEWADKPNDFLSWLMEDVKGPRWTVESLTTSMLFLNFTAIHTSSSSFTHALFYLAANPQYIQPLREEVEAIVEKEGWSKAALSKMQKVDSFFKECQRVEGLGSVGVVRKALKDFTFSDGTIVPKGTTIGIATRPIHYDEASYKNAHAFEPFRFVNSHEEGGGDGIYQFTSTTTEYLPFGRGRHACPGRFFAANELKTMLAHVVVTYDIKLADDAKRPQSLHFGVAIVPNMSAKVMFRRRVD